MKRKLLHIITVVTLLFFPGVNFAQAPDLGTASGFALFTSIGAFNNVGATYVTGNVGTNAGAFTGFPPGTVVGQIHVADPSSEQAAACVGTAYSDLSETTCGIVLGTPFGTGDTLVPGVYCTVGASALNGDLTLDGQGDPDALFIFKIDGALSTSTFSNIILIGSTSLYNVYWQVAGGAFELNTGSVFRGTIVAGGAITLLEGSSLLGRGLSTAGAINLYNNIVTVGIPPLSIKLLSFIAFPVGVNVQINWSTASETDNDYFVVQRSDDLIYFEEIQQMHGAGNSNAMLYYSAIDYNPYDGISYYRLKQTDFNGKYTYSNIVDVDFEKSVDFSIYPNPLSISMTIMINIVSQNNNFELSIYNILGKKVINTIITKQITTLETSNLPSGIYFYKVTGNDKIIQSGKLISQQ